MCIVKRRPFFKPRPINFTRSLRHPTIRTAQSVETRTVGLHLNRIIPIPVLYKPIWLTKVVTNCPIGQNSSIAAYDLYERTARCKFISRVDFSSRLEITCNETDGARKFRWWRHYRPTWPHLEGPSRLKSTYSTRLAGLSAITKQSNFNTIISIHWYFNMSISHTNTGTMQCYQVTK